MTKCDSIKITLDLPSGAALQLAELAKAGDAVLQELGILSLQVEGDQVISVMLADEKEEEETKKSSFPSVPSLSATSSSCASSCQGGVPPWRRSSSSSFSSSSTSSSTTLSLSLSSSSSSPPGKSSNKHSSTNIVQDFMHPASDRPSVTTAVSMPPPPTNKTSNNKRRQILINPNTGHLEPGDLESPGATEHASAPPPIKDTALKLKLKLPPPLDINASSSSSASSNHHLGAGGGGGLKRPSSEVYHEGARKIPKLILSMKDKTVKMAEKAAVGSKKNHSGEEDTKKFNSIAPPASTPAASNTTPFTPSPYLQTTTSSSTSPEDASFRKSIKKGSKSNVVKNNNDRVATWTKAYNVDLINEPNDRESWKEVLDSRVKPLDTDLDMDYSHHRHRLTDSQKQPVINGYDKSLDNIKQGTEPENDPNSKPNHHSGGEIMDSPSLLPRGEDHHGHLGEDSGIESMDALSEKSPNQGDGDDLKEGSISLPPPPPPPLRPPDSSSPVNSELVESASSSSSNHRSSNNNTSHDALKEKGSVKEKSKSGEQSSSSCSSSSSSSSSSNNSEPPTHRMLNNVVGDNIMDSNNKIVATSIKSGMPQSVPIGAKMVPVKLVTVSGEGNLRLVRVSPVKNSSENVSAASHGTRTVVIKSSMLKAAAGNPSFFNPSLISKISSSTPLSQPNTPNTTIESKVPPVSSTVCLFPLKTKDSGTLFEDKESLDNGFSIYKPKIGKLSDDAIQPVKDSQGDDAQEDKSSKEESLNKTNLIKSGSLTSSLEVSASQVRNEIPSDNNTSSETVLKDV